MESKQVNTLALKFFFCLLCHSLSHLYKQPDQTKVQTLGQKTLALKIMSLDLNSAEQTAHSQGKKGIKK